MSGRGGFVAAGAAIALIGLADWLLAIRRPRHDAAVAAADTVVVQAGRLTRDGRAARAAPSPRATASPPDRLPDQVADRVRHALRLPSTMALARVAASPIDATAVCGRAAPASGEAGRRFVYAGEAGLAALDDGTADFAALWDQFCPR